MKYITINLYLFLTLLIFNSNAQESKFKKFTQKIIESNNPKIDTVSKTTSKKSKKQQTSIGLIYAPPSNSYLFTNNYALGIQIFDDVYKLSNKISIEAEVNFLLGTNGKNSPIPNSQVLISTLIGPKFYINKNINLSLRIGALYEKQNPNFSKSNQIDLVYSPKIGFQIKRIGLNLIFLTNNLFENQKSINSPMISLTYK